MTVSRVRRSLYSRLQALRQPPDGPISVALAALLQSDPLTPVLSEQHLKALDRRHLTILKEIGHCIEKYSIKTVLVDHWT